VRRLAAPLAVLAALAVAGCGAQSSGGTFEGEEKAVAEVFSDLGDAGQKSDERRVCRQLLAQDLVQKLGDCNAKIDDALKSSDSFDVTVEEVKVTGTSAEAEVQTTRGDKDETRTVTLAKEGDTWKIADLGDPPA
jgi:hypothetical protein